MKQIFLLLMTLITTGTLAEAENPFFSSYKTPHQSLPFNKVKIEHFLPAFERAFVLHDDEIKKITDEKAAPTFENTIAALDYSGKMLHEVSSVFYTLSGSENDDKLMELASKVASMQTEHANKITL